jgi:cytochrome c-type biogenesis protein CcmH
MRAVLLLLFLLAAWPAAAGVEPNEMLADPVLEARARALSQEIRCLVCQSESIDTSNADLARDLRILVRERIKAGDSDPEVLDYLVARYGDFVLLRPPMKLKTALLWFGPFLALLLGGGVVLYFARHGRNDPGRIAVPLSPEERARLARMLESEATR